MFGFRLTATACLAAGVVGLLLGTTTAEARCTRLGFSVNDYGKEGPTRDAKALLDKYIAQWTKERGIARYSVGKKDVTCELFLDVGFFDEWTCKATASVCWADSIKPKAPAAPAAAPAPAKSSTPAAPAAPRAAPAEAPAAPPPAKARS